MVGGSTLVAAQTNERSEVVLVFDVSNSILENENGTNLEFAAALNGIADRVGDIADDLAAGHATVSFVAFGRTATPYPADCQALALHEDPAVVARFEACLREIAADYAAGPNAAVKQALITSGTDYVAALDQAAALLPDKSTRSAVVFFTDGKHDPPGTVRDDEDVVAAIAPAFEGRTPLAILPVGLGRAAGRFQTDLTALYQSYLRDMAPCEGRAAFSWPQVAFPSGNDAGAAVALALQEVTCSFTVAPTPTAGPSLPPPPTTPPATEPPAPTATPEPAGPTGPLCGDFVGCNPWLLPVVLAILLVGLLAILVVFLRRYLDRRRIWVTVQVDGGPNRSLGWGREHGIGLVQEQSGWYAAPRPPQRAPIRIHYEGKNRFVVQSAAGIRNVHQGDPAPVREGTGETHQLIVRLYRQQPRETIASTAPRDDAGANALGARLDGSGDETARGPRQLTEGPYIGGAETPPEGGDRAS